MNVFMVWCKNVGETIWYTVYSEDLETFHCEVFPYTLDWYHSAISFVVRRVEGGWQLEQDYTYQKQVAHAIEYRLETDPELKKY